MKTITIQIGNSDDKLPQHAWSAYIREVNRCVQFNANEVHFSGHSHWYDPWQNAAWVVCCDDERAKSLRNALSEIRQDYTQDSIAWTMGETEFV